MIGRELHTSTQEGDYERHHRITEPACRRDQLYTTAVHSSAHPESATEELRSTKLVGSNQTQTVTNNYIGGRKTLPSREKRTMGLLDDINDEQLATGSELLRTVVPGYDYRSHEQLRQTTDKLREKLRRDLTQALRRLDAVHDRLYDAGRRTEAERVTTLKNEFETMRRRVDTGQSGGGSIRNVAFNDENTLLTLIEYDATLVTTSETLVDQTGAMADPTAEDDIDDQLAECERTISEFERAFRERRDRLSGLR